MLADLFSCHHYKTKHAPQQTAHQQYPHSHLASTARDFVNLERYQSRQPSVYNMYFGINLITAVEKLPPLSRVANEAPEVNLQ